MNRFYCDVVGGGIDTLACDTRIQQAEAIKASGQEHMSLFKCLKCTNKNRQIMIDRQSGNMKSKEEVKTEAIIPKVTKKAPAAQVKEETIEIAIDFIGHEDLYKEVARIAGLEFRTPEMQILYWLSGHLR